MTEQEWVECTNPKPLLELLRGNSSERKLRLFAWACCRRIWHLISDPRSRQAVEAIELYVDKIIDEDEYSQSIEPALAALEARSKATRSADNAATCATAADPDWAAAVTGDWAADAVADSIVEQALERDEAAYEEADRTAGVEEREQCCLLHEIFGNPFRSVTLDPAWLEWNNGTVNRLAEAIYKERSFSDMPILADALEDAGCADPVLLEHLRRPGPHVRGCWAIDLLTGRE